MRKLIFAALAVVGLLTGSAVQAADFTVGSTEFRPLFVCDTEGQVTAIDMARQQGGSEAARAIIEAFMQQRNAAGEAACGQLVGTWTYLGAYPALTPAAQAGETRWVGWMLHHESGTTYWGLFRTDTGFAGAATERPIPEPVFELPEQSSEPTIGL